MCIPRQCPKPPYLPQPLCWIDVRSQRVVYVERDHYISNSAVTSETTGTLSSFLIIYSHPLFFDTILRVILSVMRGDTCSFSSLFISSPPTLSFYISPHQSLWLACFHTPFSMLALGIPTVENSACFIWVWKQCANIACLYPLGGIMATITHWFSTKTDISLSLCWQTRNTSHSSVTLFFSYKHSLFSLRLSIFCLFCVICLSTYKSWFLCCHPQFTFSSWYHTTRKRSWPLKDEMEIAHSKSFRTDHFTHA